MVTKFFGLPTGTYHHYFRLFLPPIDIVDSFIKAMVFAVASTLMHCYYGYRAAAGRLGWAWPSGRAIRVSIIVVVLLNLFLSLIMFGGVSTARLVG